MLISQVKRIDELGRIVIPKQIRNQLSITNKDELNIYLKDNVIQIERTYPTFNAEEYIRNFIKFYFGNEYVDVLISDEICSKFFELVFDFVQEKIIQVNDENNY